MSITKGAVWLLVAIAIAMLGEMTRTYSAFGGEDVLALLIVGCTSYAMLKGVKEND